jgi:hypothetical protein
MLIRITVGREVGLYTVEAYLQNAPVHFSGRYQRCIEVQEQEIIIWLI